MEYLVPTPPVVAESQVAEVSASRGLIIPMIIPMIIQTILLDPSEAVWTDIASHVSRPDPSGVNQSDVEHQATDVVVGYGFA
jgi:hypothetical protein